VQENTLKTSSVLVESLLGQADALDCFSIKIQDAEAQRGYQDLTEREQRIQAEGNKTQLDLERTKFQLEQERIKAELERNERDQRFQREMTKIDLEYEKTKNEQELLRLQMEIIRNMGDPTRQAEMYKRVFGTCCETPQTVIQK
jgi:hypothetical protein